MVRQLRTADLIGLRGPAIPHIKGARAGARTLRRVCQPTRWAPSQNGSGPCRLVELSLPSIIGPAASSLKPP